MSQIDQNTRYLEFQYMPNNLRVRSSSKKIVGRRKKLKKKIIKFINIQSKRLTTVLYFVPSVFVYMTRIRFVINSNPGRIGHLAAEFDCFLKEMRLGIRPRVMAVTLLSAEEAANRCLLHYWESQIRIVRGWLLRKLLGPFLYFPYLQITLVETVSAVNETADYPSVLARWGSRAPLLSLSESHRARGEACLRELGVPTGAWFVCVHSREGGYSPHDEYLHAHRNSDINAYIPAMEAIVDRGGWCIRVGDPTMAPLQAMQGVIDYANSSQKSDWMDIFLCARCRFFLGNTSGLCIVSTIFGVPSALANLTPLSSSFPVGASDLGIPKLLKRQSGEIVSFAEAFDSPIANFRLAELYRENGLVTVNNSPEEIRDLAIEMMNRFENSAPYRDEDERLQDAFRNLFRPGHYTYGAASRVGGDFLAKYAHLLSRETTHAMTDQ